MTGQGLPSRFFQATLVRLLLLCFASLVGGAPAPSADAPTTRVAFSYDRIVQTALAQGTVSIARVGREAKIAVGAGSRSKPHAQLLEGLAAEASAAVPARLARVTEARFAGAPSLGSPGAGRVFVTAADDIQGITTSQGLAQRLTLLDGAGKLRQGPFSVSSFDTPAELGVPVFRSNPGFVQGGFTGGGAREFDLPNLRYEDLGNVAQWLVR